jgi:tRNA A37 threonylcarbamoyltransferase TsaD
MVAKAASSPEVALLRSQMTAIARVLSRAFPRTNVEFETLKTIALFCGVGLVVSLLLAATNGLDMSAGFF